VTAIRKHVRDFVAIIALFVVSGFVAVYILDHQRLRFPFFEEVPFRLKAEFSTAQAVTPGQGQTVRVSGVRVGDIAKVDLKDGVAVITMDIDREYEDLVRTDATALLRPKTGLKDMFIALNPGSTSAPVAEENFVIPVQNTLPDINPDEVYQFLDGDSRDYLKLLVGGAGEGLSGRGGDLQEVFRRFEPTHRDLARVSSAVAVRHTNLRRLINRLDVLNEELAGKGPELSSLVSTSAEVFRAFASEEQNISRAVRVLPGALRQTTATLEKVTGYADTLALASERLRPAVRSMDAANEATIPFAREAAPIVRDQVRPFTREAQPLVRDLRPAARNLAKATPDLTGSFRVLNHLFNMLGFNPNGTEGAADLDRDEGFLFWLAWLNHNAGAVFSSSDANGTFRPVTFSAPCAILKQLLNEEAGEEGNAIYNLVFSKPVFDAGLCPS
jgi:phospholipid/cholesterol/gamma-HCH transport system substrate-binding protein